MIIVFDNMMGNVSPKLDYASEIEIMAIRKKKKRGKVVLSAKLSPPEPDQMPTVTSADIY